MAEQHDDPVVEMLRRHLGGDERSRSAPLAGSGDYWAMGRRRRDVRRRVTALAAVAAVALVPSVAWGTSRLLSEGAGGAGPAGSASASTDCLDVPVQTDRDTAGGFRSPRLAVRRFLDERGGTDGLPGSSAVISDYYSPPGFITMFSSVYVDDGPGPTFLVMTLPSERGAWVVVSYTRCLPDNLPGARRVTPKLGHCWIEPIPFDGASWDLPLAKQFGTGGLQPLSWIGTGTIVRIGPTTARYVDDGGRVLTLYSDIDRAEKGWGCL